MTQIITNLEGGGSARTKINETISKANDIGLKVDKVPTAQTGNVAVWGENGVLLDGGVTPGGGVASNIPSWEDVRYSPLPIDYVIQFNGHLFASKVADNLNNLPPLEGENDFWYEVSRTYSGATPLYYPGVYEVARAEVSVIGIDNVLRKYVLRSPVPFISSNFEAELGSGDWQLLGGEGGGAAEAFTTIEINDTAISPIVNASFWQELIIDATNAPCTVIIPDEPTATSGRIRVRMRKNTHKITLSSAALIDGNSSFVLTSIGGMVEVVARAGYYVVSFETNGLRTTEVLTANRDFSDGDGVENNVFYDSNPAGGALTHLLPAAMSLPGNKAIVCRFEMSSAGTVTITDGGSFSEVINTVGTGFDLEQVNGSYRIGADTRPKIVQSSFTSVSLTESTARIEPISGQPYKARTTDLADVRISPTPIEAGVTVGVSAPDWTLLSASITDQGALVGLVGAGNINIYTTVRKAAGVQDMHYQVRYYKVTAAGVETLIATSNTLLISNTVAQQFLMVASHVEFTMAATDAIAVKTFAQRSTGSGTPTFYSTIEGANPTRSDISVPVGTLSHNAQGGRSEAGCHPATSITNTNGETVQATLTRLDYVILQFACSDETAALTASSTVAKVRIPIEFNFLLTSTVVFVTTAPTGLALTCDAKYNGTSVYSTIASIDVGEVSSRTAATPSVLTSNPLTLAAGGYIDVFTPQVGATIAGAGLKFALIGKYI